MIKVSDVHNDITIEPILVHKDEGIRSVHHKFITQKVPVRRSAYVIDDSEQVIGAITLRKIMDYVAIKKALTGSKRYSVRKLFEYISPDLVAENIMGPGIVINVDQCIQEAFQIMLDKNAEEGVVIDKDGYAIGELNIYEILRKIKIV